MAICSCYNVLSNNTHPLTPYDMYITMERLNALEDTKLYIQLLHVILYFILLLISMILCNIAMIISYATVYSLQENSVIPYILYIKMIMIECIVEL